MKAVLLTNMTGGTTLTMDEIATAPLQAGCVRLRAHAASVNRAGLLVRAGSHASAAGVNGAPAVAGLDVCGEIVEVADDVHTHHIGDRVMAMVSGGLAEQVVIPAGVVVPVPQSWSYAEGAAAITGLMTEHNALVTAARMRSGETVLVHAVTSGVATQAIQLAKVLGAGHIFGTSRSQTDSPALRALGLDTLINASDNTFADQLLEATRNVGVDVIIDHVVGPYLEENLRAAAIKGRIVGVGRLGGALGTLDTDKLARKRVEVIGVTFRTRSLAEKIAVARALQDGVDLETHADVLRPLIDRTYSWTEALDAQEALSRNTHIGKIVLEITG